MERPERFSALIVVCGAVILLVAAPLVFLGGPGSGLAAPAPTPTPVPSPTSPVPPPAPPPGQSPAPPAVPASPAATATPPGGAAPSPGAPMVVSVSITVAQEVPAPQPQTPRSAGGVGAVVLNGARSELGFAFTFSGLSGQLQAAHFHRGASAEAVPVVQTICGEPDPALSGGCPASANGTAAGVWRLPTGILADLLAGRVYVNFHTALNPGGETRGQITLPR